MEKLKIRAYGSSGPLVFVLHGGPGAPGHMAPVAEALADSFRVIEPFQRGSGPEPLTVARHVADLHELVTSQPGTRLPALVGSSWGAMLALAYAAEHPLSAGPLVLIGCGTFDLAARARLRAILDKRMDNSLREKLEQLHGKFSRPDERLRAQAELTLPLYSYDSFETDTKDEEPCDARAHEETWNDMVRLQKQGVYPASFANIRSAVLMLHGSFDPHPGRMIRDSLRPYLPQLEYHEWEHCGHYPWREKAVRDDFPAVLRNWLGRHLTIAAEGARY